MHAPSRRPPEPLTVAAPAVATFAIMFGAMVVMPAVRPLLALRGAPESAMHAFASVGMFGAVALGPLLARYADRSGAPLRVAAALAVADAAVSIACVTTVGTAVLLALRFVQGALNVGALSITMSLAPAPHTAGRAMAGRGAAMMLALVFGPPVGGAALAFGPSGPFVIAAAAVVVAATILVGCSFSGEAPVTRQVASIWTSLSPPRGAHLVVAAALAFAERFTVGCFVVTFAVHAHDTLRMGDREISLAYAAMVAPFALAIYPLMRGAIPVRRTTSIALGGTAYAAAFVALAVAPYPAVYAVLGVAGVASALVYAPALCYASLAPRERATNMALFHGAGCLGMAIGPAVAGALGAAMRAQGVSAGMRHGVVFVLAAAAQLLVLVLLRSRLAALASRESSLAPTAEEVVT